MQQALEFFSTASLYCVAVIIVDRTAMKLKLSVRLSIRDFCDPLQKVHI